MPSLALLGRLTGAHQPTGFKAEGSRHSFWDRVLVRLVDPDHLSHLANLFAVSLADTTSSWHLVDEDGEQKWVRHAVDEEGEPLLDLQTSLMPRQRARVTIR